MSSVETMSRWPSLVQSVVNLPSRYADSFVQYTGKSDCTDMYAVFAPLVDLLWFHRGGQLICIDGNVLHFFRSSANGVAYNRIYKSNLNYVRQKTCLLSSELELNVKNGDAGISLKTEFNSVRDDLYKPVSDFLRGPKRTLTMLVNEREQKFRYLIDKNFKLMNLSLHAYDRGQGSIDHHYQPPIRIKKGWFTKKITDGVLYILTEDELIIMEDIEYGTEYHYIRRAAISDVKYSAEGGYNKLTIALQKGELKFPYSLENTEAMERLTKRFQPV
jgi:hypothetical protein